MSITTKYLNGTEVYHKAGPKGLVLASFKRLSGKIWVVFEDISGRLYFADQNNLHLVKKVPFLQYRGRKGYEDT